MYRHYDQTGTKARDLYHTPTEAELAVLADDGLPRTVRVQPIPEHARATETVEAQRDGGWKIVPRSEESIASEKAALRTKIAARRWEMETAGIDVEVANGTVQLDTDPVSQGKLLGLAFFASQQPIRTGWKSKDGTFTEIRNADVLLMASTAFGHVQACFVREAELAAALADEKADLKAIEAALESFF